jgi:hypothetical protein
MEPEFSSPATNDEQPTETSSKPGKSRMIDDTHLGLAFQFLGVKKPSDESV